MIRTRRSSSFTGSGISHTFFPEGQVLQLPSSRSRLSTRATSDPFRVIHLATDQRGFLTLRYFLPGQVFLLSYLLPAGQVFLLSYLLPGGSGISTQLPSSLGQVFLPSSRTCLCLWYSVPRAPDGQVSPSQPSAPPELLNSIAEDFTGAKQNPQ